MEILLFDLGPEGCPDLPGSDHPRVRKTRMGSKDLLAAARARGVHAAKAPVISFLEEHCEMQPGWAEVVASNLGGPWAAIGTDFINGNPDAGNSNKAFRMNYGVYVRPVTPRGPVSMIAGQNSAFRREVLLRYEPQLELMLSADLVLQWKMQQDGHRLFYEPGAKIAHRNENTFSSLAFGAFYWNWCFSNIRAEIFKWSFLRRTAWVLASPLIPWVRLARLFARVVARGHVPVFQFMRDIPFIVGVSHCSAAGQVVGLLTRADPAIREFSNFEMNEPRLTRPEFVR
jgi:Glycosyl transferase family 2